MIKTRDELMAKIKERFGEDTSDETLSLIEDVTDTFSDLENKAIDTTDWKAKYEQNDKEWREKYKERFFGSTVKEEEEKYEEEKPRQMKTFDELFKIKEA